MDGLSGILCNIRYKSPTIFIESAQLSTINTSRCIIEPRLSLPLPSGEGGAAESGWVNDKLSKGGDQRNLVLRVLYLEII